MHYSWHGYVSKSYTLIMTSATNNTDPLGSYQGRNGPLEEYLLLLCGFRKAFYIVPGAWLMHQLEAVRVLVHIKWGIYAPYNVLLVVVSNMIGVKQGCSLSYIDWVAQGHAGQR